MHMQLGLSLVEPVSNAQLFASMESADEVLVLPLVQTLLQRLGAECDEFFIAYLAASLADDCQDPAELLAGGVDEQLAAICPGVAAEERQVLLLETIEQVCITTNVLSVGFFLALHGGQSCKLQLSNTSQPCTGATCKSGGPTATCQRAHTITGTTAATAAAGISVLQPGGQRHGRWDKCRPV